MPCLQPEIMIINGFYQNRPGTATIGAEGIGKNLISYQCRLGCRNLELGKTFLNTLGKGFFRMGNTM